MNARRLLIAACAHAAIAAATLASPLHAQDTGRAHAAPAVLDDTAPPLPPVDGLRLPAGTLTYRATLHLPRDSARVDRAAFGVTAAPAGGDSLRAAGMRTVRVQPTLYAGGTAWAIAERVDGVTGEVSDSLVVARADLQPLHWEGTRGPARLAAELARDTLYAGATWPNGRRSIVSALGGPVLTTQAHVEAVVSLLPFEPGWRAAARLLLVDLGGARVLPVTIMVEGIETVDVAAGRFDCWVVTMFGDRVEERFWVRRERPVVVRRQSRVPALGGTLELSLEREER